MRLGGPEEYLSAGGSVAIISTDPQINVIQGQVVKTIATVAWLFEGFYRWPFTYTWDRNVYTTLSLRRVGQDPVMAELSYCIDSGTCGDREGSYIYTDILLPIVLPVGSHTLYLQAEAFALFEAWSDGFPSGLYILGELVSEEIAILVNVISGRPDCAFAFTPSGGSAPLFVEFTDLSTSPVEDVTWSYSWSFGDGDTSTLRDPTHVFEDAGNYYVELTVKTKYGSDKCGHSIQVEAAECFPQFTSCWTPSPVGVAEAFSPRLRVKNQGSACNIWIEAEIEGKFKTLVPSRYLVGYDEIDIEIDPHTVSWYLDYTPDEPMIMYTRFWVGPEGEEPGDAHTWFCDKEIYVTIEVPPPPPPPVARNLVLAAGGALVLGGGALMLLGRKK